MNISDYTSKRCSKCGNEFPLTDKFWHKRKASPDGYKSVCKVCRKVEGQEYRRNNSEKRKATLRRYAETHREQILSKQRHYYQENKEKVREYAQDYREKNRETIRAKNREYYRTQYDRIAQYRKSYAGRQKEHNQRYREQNPEKIKRYLKQYREENKDRIRALKRAAKYRRRSKAKENGGTHTFHETLNLYAIQGGMCFHCGTELSASGYHEDHWIPVIKGGSDDISNIRLLCPPCNLSKGNKLPPEWDSRYS